MSRALALLCVAWLVMATVFWFNESLIFAQTTVLSASPTTVPAGGTVTATWSGLATPTPRDWLGLYTPSAANTSFLAWMYVSCTQSPGSARAAGSCAFPVPATLAPGTYQLRLLANNGFTLLATSNPFTITSGGVTLTVTKAGSGSGTVTSTPAGITCGSTCSAAFAQGTSVTLTASAASGATFAGWSGAGCSGTGTCLVSLTQARTVTATFTSTGGGVTLSGSPTSVAAGGTVTATWSGIATPSATDWLGLYTPGAANTGFLTWMYVSCTQAPGSARAAGSCGFPVPSGLAAGTYELRLLAQDGYTRLATSNAFTVTSGPGGTWPVSTPAAEGMDPTRFAAALAALPSPVVVVRHGKIVGSKGDITNASTIWSGSKTLTAMLAARLMQQGQISFNTVVPGSDTGAVGGSCATVAPTATVRNFLTMTTDYCLNPHSPGTHYAYNNGAVHHYCEWMRITYYGSVSQPQIMLNAFGTALGLEDALWFEGYCSGWDGGWAMSTRDWARVGQLLLQGGAWDGVPLLPSSFVSDMYTRQIPTGATWNSFDGTGQFYNETALGPMDPAYSYGLWVAHEFPPEDSRHTETEAIVGAGAFGTTLFVSRATDLVIAAVHTGSSHGENLFQGAWLDAMADTIWTFPGRVALSADGNDHDCDDYTATPMTLALLAKTGNASKLVYYGYADHIWSTATDGLCNGGNRETEMQTSAEGTATRWGGFNMGVFYNAKAETAAAVAALRGQINASSASDPLWILEAGPPQVIGEALAASQVDKRQYVTVISHSTWNDTHAEQHGAGNYTFAELGAGGLGANTYHIADQNAGLAVATSNYYWLRDATDPNLRWLWDRYVVSGMRNFDPSDAGMTYWLLTGNVVNGDEGATPTKLRTLLTGVGP